MTVPVELQLSLKVPYNQPQVMKKQDKIEEKQRGKKRFLTQEVFIKIQISINITKK